jgi:hypothetical protein
MKYVHMLYKHKMKSDNEKHSYISNICNTLTGKLILYFYMNRTWKAIMAKASHILCLSVEVDDTKYTLFIMHYIIVAIAELVLKGQNIM